MDKHRGRALGFSGEEALLIQSGTVVDGYRIERLLGFGGMGIVYEATQMSLDRRVALKVLRTSLAEDDALGTRLQSEGRLQASIEHPNVLDAYEVGESEFGLFLSMRLVEGGDSLARELESGELNAERALDLLGQAASALDAAHAAGLVHGDVKPQNILVDGDGTAYLGDFGLTRAGGESLTASRALLGTVAYVAPEIIAGEAAKAPSDIYSFAATDVPLPHGRSRVPARHGRRGHVRARRFAAARRVRAPG